MPEIGTPGDGISRRAFLAATGASGLGSVASCTAPTGRRNEGAAAAASASDELPTMSLPEVVDVNERGGQVTLSSQPARHEMDSTNLAPAERHTIEFEADADPGIYLVHCHKVNHAMNGEIYPGGMVGGGVYESAMDTDIFADLMEYAGYEG